MLELKHSGNPYFYGTFSEVCSPLQRDSDRRYMMAEDELLEPIDFTLAAPETMPIPVALRELVISSV